MNSAPGGLGGVCVRVTERGLPVAITLDRRILTTTSPDALAKYLLLRCRYSAQQAQVARRRHLEADECGRSIAHALHLCTEQELADTEVQLFGERDEDAIPGWTTWR